MSEETFEALGLRPNILETLQKLGYEKPTGIQSEAIPILLRGENLLGIAKTGTGKTAAFTLPLLDRLDPSSDKVQILVLVPTRELGQQVAKSFETYGAHLGKNSVACIYGGQDARIQIRALKQKPSTIVATPGRLIDLMDRKQILLADIQAVVLDEADEMLRMGFEEEVRKILEQVPEEAQMALFSATMPGAIRSVADRWLKGAQTLHVDQGVKTVGAIDQFYVMVNRRDKLDALERIIEAEPVDAGIVFVKTRQQTLEVAEHLERLGLRTSPLNGDLQQNMRETTIRQLKEGHLDWLVATDVAARGLDVPRITHVINFELPFDRESYVHRIGRTGRAGREGRAILLMAPSEKRQLFQLEKHTGAPIAKMNLPGGQEISERRIEAFTKKLLQTVGQQDLKRMKKLVNQVIGSTELELETLAGALAYMAQEGKPLFPVMKPLAEPTDRGNAKSGAGAMRSGGGRRERAVDANSQRYRLAVGREHGVRPGDIVGAITNEGGLSGDVIGNITLFDHYCTVDLPKGLTEDARGDISRIRVRNRPLQMRIWSDAPSSGEGRGRPSGGGSFRKDKDDWASRARKKPFRSRGSAAVPREKRSKFNRD